MMKHFLSYSKSIAWKVVALAAIFCGCLFYTQRTLGDQKAQQAPIVLRAQKFELVDKNGKVRAALTQVDGTTVFGIGGTDGKAALLVSVHDDTSSITLVSPKNKTSVQLTADNAPEIRIIGKNGLERKIIAE